MLQCFQGTKPQQKKRTILSTKSTLRLLGGLLLLKRKGGYIVSHEIELTEEEIDEGLAHCPHCGKIYYEDELIHDMEHRKGEVCEGCHYRDGEI